LVAGSSEIAITGATDINERGEIFGTGVLPNGDSHLVLLIPCGDGDETCGISAGATVSTEGSPAPSTQNLTNPNRNKGEFGHTNSMWRSYHRRQMPSASMSVSPNDTLPPHFCSLSNQAEMENDRETNP
jgi:hypothetical protein